MKLFTLLTLLLSWNVQANDGGIYYLNVQNLKQEAVHPDNKIDKVQIKFEGKDAALLAKSLPKAISVEPEVTKNSRSLALIDEKQNSSVVIYCTTSEYDIELGKFVKYDTTKCSITLTEIPRKTPDEDVSIYELYGDATKLEDVSCKFKD